MATIKISEALLARLKLAGRLHATTPEELAARGISELLDALSTKRAREPSARPSLRERIRAAYLQVTGGRTNEYVRLADLRPLLPGEDREAVDGELRAFQQRGEAVLYPIDDPHRIKPADNAAAMRVSGERRDLFLLRA